MSASAPSPELLALVNDFLASNGFDKAAKALSKQAKDQSITLAANTSTTLTALFDARPKEAAATTTAAADDSSDASDSSSDESSDSESEDEKKPAKKVASKKTRKVTPPSSDSSDSESSEDEKPAVKKTKAAKKVDTSSDSSSASSSSESSDSSDSSDSDSSDSDSSSSSSSSSSSDSDSSSSSDSDSSSSSDSDSSDSESESEKKKKSAKAAKVEKPAKKEKADKKEKKEKKLVAKAEPSSDSAASSVTLADAPLKAVVDTLMVPASSALGQAEGTAAPSNDAEEHMHPSRKRKLGGAFGEAEQQVAVPATDENIKRAKKENVPFSRIPKDQVVDPRLTSNAFVPYDYAQKAHEALIVTKGKAFTKAKNKGKRGSYRGGIIDQTPKGIQFED